MTCNPRNVSEIPGSYVSCQILIVRECLSVNGVDVITTVHTDGVTVQGDGSVASPVAIKAVQHDLTITGLGTVASPLSVVAGAPGTVITDGVTLTGNGSGPTPVKLLAVQTDDSLVGAGTLLSHLSATKLHGVAGTVDTTGVFAGVPVQTMTCEGGISVQAQNASATVGFGGLALFCDGALGSATTLGSRTGSADINIGALVGAVHDNPKLFLFDLKDCGGLANIGVGPAGTARFAYDLATNQVYVSKNGAAFVAVVTL